MLKQAIVIAAAVFTANIASASSPEATIQPMAKQVPVSTPNEHPAIKYRAKFTKQSIVHEASTRQEGDSTWHETLSLTRIQKTFIHVNTSKELFKENKIRLDNFAKTLPNAFILASMPKEVAAYNSDPEACENDPSLSEDNGWYDLYYETLNNRLVRQMTGPTDRMESAYNSLSASITASNRANAEQAEKDIKAGKEAKEPVKDILPCIINNGNGTSTLFYYSDKVY